MVFTTCLQEWEFVIHDWVRGGQGGPGRTYRPGVRTPGLLSRENSLGGGAGGGLLSSSSGLDLAGLEPPGMSRTGRTTGGSSGGGAAPAGKPGSAGASMHPQLHARPGAGGPGDESMSVDFDEDEDVPGMLPGLGPGPANTLTATNSAAKFNRVTSLAARTPGVLLDEDVEDVDTGTGHLPPGTKAAAPVVVTTLASLSAGGAKPPAPGTTTSSTTGTKQGPPGTPSQGGRPPLPPTPGSAKGSAVGAGGLRSSGGGVLQGLSSSGGGGGGAGGIQWHSNAAATSDDSGDFGAMPAQGAGPGQQTPFAAGNHAAAQHSQGYAGGGGLSSSFASSGGGWGGGGGGLLMSQSSDLSLPDNSDPYPHTSAALHRPPSFTGSIGSGRKQGRKVRSRVDAVHL
jgi:hypothetical protein